MYWEKYTFSQIKSKVFEALSKNANYRSENILGLPGTFLDTDIFYDDAPFLKDAPFLSTLIANPNHIGVHTFGDEHEDFFAGTQEIEKNLIKICAEEIFGAEEHSYDGYVAGGGTEANIEALWIYRNYFIEEFMADINDIAVIYSADTHYSIPKAVDLLNLQALEIEVDPKTRELNIFDLEEKIKDAINTGFKYFIVNVNMSTTMFGSVDDIEKITSLLNLLHLNYKLHVDGAFGGFIYPFTSSNPSFSFKNPNITSFSIDGHKMLQAPYGTGIFLIRKDYLKYVCTNEAGYVKGKDFTLCGSRSGANAVCVWMILRMHGSAGWSVKMNQLIDKTTSICDTLDELGVKYYRNPSVNIIAIQGKFISPHISKKYHLVPSTHNEKPDWYKIVVMPHVKQGIIDNFLNELKNELHKKQNI
jgi:tyrosine decarboxylase / aspartate 1-decarboxylase